MTFSLFKKNSVVGVSVNPELGLEIAQIDFESKTVLKYGSKQLAYDNMRREIADMDVFKETLSELLTELDIPKGTDIVLNIPTVAFKITDYPAALNEEQIVGVIDEELLENPLFQDTEAVASSVILPNSTIQFNKVTYTAAQKTMLIEIAMQISDLGYNLIGIDTSVNSTLNALTYCELVDTAPDVSWTMLLVENNCCRVFLMQGKNYVDCFEEKISIGEVLGDAENFSIVTNAVQPILKNIPSKRLYVISKTNVISAKALASQLKYSAQIIHLEANNFNNTAFLETVPELEEKAKMISVDVIGAAINREFSAFSTAKFNLFNKSLGDIYTMSQPPILKFNSLEFVLSLQNMIVASIAWLIIILIAVVAVLLPISTSIAQKEEEKAKLERNIEAIEKFLEQNKSISTSLFDEGDEMRIGLVHNKGIYSYYTIVGTEIPKKLWLTSLNLGKNTTIEGQADNLESVYSFFRNIKDYNPESKIKLQKLGLATNSGIGKITAEAGFDTDSIITSMNADFYEFKISDAPEVSKEKLNNNKNDKNNKSGSKKNFDLEPLD